LADLDIAPGGLLRLDWLGWFEPSELQQEGIEGGVALEAGFGLVGKPDRRRLI
jgi:hypothetical protein